jgi:hypothetical protein
VVGAGPLRPNRRPARSAAISRRTSGDLAFVEFVITRHEAGQISEADRDLYLRMHNRLRERRET